MGASLVAVGALVLAFATLPFNRHPLHPWEVVGSNAYAKVVNTSDHAVDVWARAPQVDTATRFLGTVPLLDSATLRLPYADTKVSLYIGDLVLKLDTDRPMTWRIVVK